jgi:Tol biopolymer transport system component
MNYVEPKRELMVVPANGGTPKQLTFTGGEIFDFDTAPSGDYVAYPVLNDKKGFDLWLVERSCKSPHRLLDCGANRCNSPVFSADGNTIAYPWRNLFTQG